MLDTNNMSDLGNTYRTKETARNVRSHRDPIRLIESDLSENYIADEVEQIDSQRDR